jgi:ankyrin repeat protein
MPDKPFSKPRAIDFLRACKSRNINYLKEMIAEDKWIVHVYDSSGENGLHWACKRDSIEVVRALLDGGCFVDSRDYAGRTPLYIAVRYNSEGCVQMLLENKAAINLSSYSGRKIFDVLQRSSMKSILKRYHTTKLKSSIAKSIQGNREKNARLDK